MPRSWLAHTPPQGRYLAIGLVVLLFFPLALPNPAITSIAVFTLLYMAAASSWNAFSGYSGYISFGHTVFFGVGAYTVALLGGVAWLHSPLGALDLVPVAGVVAGLVAIPYGAVALRTRRLVFIIVTLATFFAVQLLAYNLPFTNGSAGLVVLSPNWGGIEFNDVVYYCSLVLLCATVVMSLWIRRSRFGLHLLAIRDDETRAVGLGIDTVKVKLVAFTMSAVPIGMVGALYAYFLGTVYPDTAFTPVFDLTMLLFAIVGGIGTMSGPLLGAFLLQPAGQYLTLVAPTANLNLIVYGALLLVVIVALPSGIVPTLAGWAKSRGSRQAASPPSGAQKRGFLRPPHD
jgi:branched-chain amino acid transport system permease protein